MKCSECGKTVPITKVLQPKDDAVTCMYCGYVIPAESLTWSDGKFHFTVLGDVASIKLINGPRVLMREQVVKTLDIRKLRAAAIKIIRREPNLRCVCGEFQIQDSDIRIELLPEKK